MKQWSRKSMRHLLPALSAAAILIAVACSPDDPGTRKLDETTPIVSVRAVTPEVTEGEIATVTFTADPAPKAGEDITVIFRHTEGTADPTNDYSISITSPNTSATARIMHPDNTVNVNFSTTDDGVTEGKETFIVRITNVIKGKKPAADEDNATVTIIDKN